MSQDQLNLANSVFLKSISTFLLAEITWFYQIREQIKKK